MVIKSYTQMTMTHLTISEVVETRVLIRGVAASSTAEKNRDEYVTKVSNVGSIEECRK